MPAAQGAGGVGIGAGRAAQAQIDPPRIEGFKGAELLGDHQRRMVRQHYPTGANPNATGAGSQITDQHGGGRTGDAVHVVVLGHPETGVAERFHMLGQGQGVMQGLRRAAVGANRREVQGGNLDLCQFHKSLVAPESLPTRDPRRGRY